MTEIQQNTKKCDISSWINTGATIISAVATSFIAIIAIFQLCALLKTDESVRLQTRSYLIYNKIDFPRKTDGFKAKDGQEYFQFYTIWSNQGNIPAEKIKLRVGCSHNPYNSDGSLHFDNTDSAKNNVIYEKWSLGPKSEIFIPSCPLTDHALNLYTDGKNKIHIFGQAEYTDATSLEQRKSEFCARIVDFRITDEGPRGSVIPCKFE